jgi:hypothetical protein
MDDDALVACPNCDLLVAPSDLAPISIGCIFRHTKRVERSHRLLVRSGQLNEPQNGKSIELTALFSNSTMNWMPLPPILSNLHYNFAEIAHQRALQVKDVRVCTACRALFIDDEEIAFRMQKESSHAAKNVLREEAKKKLRHRLQNHQPNDAPVARFADRKTDMVFTDLQITHRRLDRLLEDKKKARQELVQKHPQKIDWGDDLSKSTTKEIRRLQGVQSPSRSPDQGRHGEEHSSAHPAVPPFAPSATYPLAGESPRRLTSARALVAVPPPVVDSIHCDHSASPLREPLPTLRPGTGGSHSLFGGRSPPSRRRRSAPSSQQRKEKEVHDRQAYGVDPNGLTPLPFHPLHADDEVQLESIIAADRLMTHSTVAATTAEMVHSGNNNSKMVSSFDVPLSQRFMHELWVTMCATLDYGASDDCAAMVDVRQKNNSFSQKSSGPLPQQTGPHASNPSRKNSISMVTTTSVISPHPGAPRTAPDPSAELDEDMIPITVAVPRANPSSTADTVPVSHPFYPLYRRNQLRLPTPPITHLLRQPSAKASVTQVEDEILAVDQQFLRHEQKIFQKGISNLLFSDQLLLETEKQLLQEVVADRTVVLSNEDDPFATFYDEEGGDGGEEDEEFVDVDEEDDMFDDEGY